MLNSSTLCLEESIGCCEYRYTFKTPISLTVEEYDEPYDDFDNKVKMIWNDHPSITFEGETRKDAVEVLAVDICSLSQCLDDDNMVPHLLIMRDWLKANLSDIIWTPSPDFRIVGGYFGQIRLKHVKDLPSGNPEVPTGRGNLGTPDYFMQLIAYTNEPQLVFGQILSSYKTLYDNSAAQSRYVDTLHAKIARLEAENINLVKDVAAVLFGSGLPADRVPPRGSN